MREMMRRQRDELRRPGLSNHVAMAKRDGGHRTPARLGLKFRMRIGDGERHHRP